MNLLQEIDLEAYPLLGLLDISYISDYAHQQPVSFGIIDGYPLDKNPGWSRGKMVVRLLNHTFPEIGEDLFISLPVAVRYLPGERKIVGGLAQEVLFREAHEPANGGIDQDQTMLSVHHEYGVADGVDYQFQIVS